ncbi:MAG: hypothetical protein OYH76_00515 [Defluviicoccus sp.]|nr:hypothetical protein [Defluviicoccus sp.]MDE0274346.1 hypothetical protein [Defluviicoccus sp.]
MTAIWILVVAFTTTASPSPVIPEPAAFIDERSCQEAQRSLRAADLQPYSPPNSRIVAVRSGCLAVDVTSLLPAREDAA